MSYLKNNTFLDLENVWKFSLCLISLFPIFPRIYGSITMLLFFAISVILFKKRKKKFYYNDIIKFLILSSVFIIYLVSAFYSNNFEDSLNFIKISLPLLMFPMVFILLVDINIDDKLLTQIKKSFVFSLLISTIIINIKLGFLLFEDMSQWEYRNEFENFKDVHGTYYSLWLGFANLILIKEILEKVKSKEFIKIFIIIIIITYFLYWQITLLARLPLFITLLLFVIFFINIIKAKKIFLILFALSLSVVSLIVIYTQKEKILQKINFELPQGDYELKHLEITSEQIRMGIYFCSFDIFKRNFLLGTGVGDVNSDLNKCYKNKIPSNVYQILKYNTHNQYLQIMLSGGIVGLVFFIYNLFFLCRVAFLKKDILYSMFLIMILICFLTENILSRHNGVIFFSFFSIIFFSYNSKK